MEVVYLFCEPAFTRIPVYDHDPRLLRLFSGRGGTWNSAGREFIFSRNIRAEEFTGILKGIPWVWVEKNAPLPAGRGGRLRIYNFRDRPWEETAGFASDVFFGRWLLKLEAELRSRKYSPRTLRAYVYYNRLICNTLKKTPEEIRPEDVKVFLAGIEKNRDYSSSSINLAISAIKFFYKNVVKNETMKEQHRPHHDKRLPVILDKAEISSILNLEKNPKHRLLLMLTYSSGLRVSEVVALKREHIDLARGVIYVRLGKGRKDRCTLLSEKAARYITEYFSLNEISTWLFPGQPPDRPLSIRAAQLIFDKAVRRAEIRKKISIHCLRHTFATHLLEGGTDIRYIQTLLGHANLRTTERYTHVARRSVLHIQSPLDTIL